MILVTVTSVGIIRLFSPHPSWTNFEKIIISRSDTPDWPIRKWLNSLIPPGSLSGGFFQNCTEVRSIVKFQKAMLLIDVPQVGHRSYLVIIPSDMVWEKMLSRVPSCQQESMLTQIFLEAKEWNWFQNIWKMQDIWITMSANGILDIEAGVIHQPDEDLIDRMAALVEECSKLTLILHWLKIGIIRIT